MGKNTGRKYTEVVHKKTYYSRVIDFYKEGKYNTFIHEVNTFLNRSRYDKDLLFFRAKAYRKLKMFDYAIEDLKSILKNGYDKDAFTELYFLYYYLNMYNEAISLLPVMYEKRPINAYSVALSELIMKLQLKIDIKTKKGDKNDYIKTQVFSYSTNLALEHIKNNHEYSTDRIQNLENSYFEENVNIKYLYDTVRSQIKESEKANIDEVLEVHYFLVPNIGYLNNQNCNYLKVVIVPNTDHVIAMYPTIDVGLEAISNLEYDYNILFNKEETKVKNLSQIEKFNKRYGRV